MACQGSSYSPHLIEGEVSLRVIESVTYDNLSLQSQKPIFGLFIITNFRVLFVSQPCFVAHQMKGIDPDYDDSCNCNLPICVIDKIKRKKNEIIFECKDIRLVKFSFGTMNDADSAFMGVEQFLAVKQTNRFCFVNKELEGPKKAKKVTPYVFDVASEYERFCKKHPQVRERWCLSDYNDNFAICSTYPKKFITPSSLKESDIAKAAEHRSRGRIPILSYIHQNGASITRCAQPKKGLTGGKSKADVKFGNALVNATPHAHGLHIMDARPKLNAKANGAVGGGHENTSHYEKATLKFLDIENIHVMRDCLGGFKELCLNPSSVTQWLTAVDNTMCLTHIKIILDGALSVVELVEKGGAVMVHCSDGWDRTAQLCGLVALILDPYYRTIDGFMVSVEKEWVQAGHKFNDRIGQDNLASRNERSPVFLQFVDCVWQITQQFPTAFEFNECLLLDMLQALYSCRFGTFLFNCEKEREDNRVRETTPSFWEYVQENRLNYMNPCYDPPISGHGPTTLQTGVPTVLPVSTSTKDIRIWYNYYMQHVSPGRVSLAVMLQNEIRRLRDILKQKGYEEEKDSGQLDILAKASIITQTPSAPPPTLTTTSPPPTENKAPVTSWGSVRPKTSQQTKLVGRGNHRPLSTGLTNRRTSPRAPPPPCRQPPDPNIIAANKPSPIPPALPPATPALPPSLVEEPADEEEDEGVTVMVTGADVVDEVVDEAEEEEVRGMQYASVKHPWTARDENELTVVTGDLVVITRMSNENWWYVTKVDDESQHGHVPSTYLVLEDD